jgi:hypothetical protein
MKKLIVIAMLGMAIITLPSSSQAHPLCMVPVVAAKSSFIASGGLGLIFAPVTAAAIWHIPAWDVAKDAGTEAAYQKQEMWPQQLFDKLPGGKPGRLNVQVTPAPTAPVGGYWEEKMTGQKQ